MPEELAWIEGFRRELERGNSARLQGNEGMARVCARRAAGIVVRAYFDFRGISFPGQSVLIQLRALAESLDEPNGVRDVARHFVLQIDHDHRLPEGVDLLADVEWLRSVLFPD